MKGILRLVYASRAIEVERLWIVMILEYNYYVAIIIVTTHKLADLEAK